MARHCDGRGTNVLAAKMVAALLLVGCQGAISPQPEPPVRQSPTIEFGAVEAKVDSFTNDPPGLRGGPGSVFPPGATLRAVNLDNILDPKETIVADDGSFEVLMSLAIGDEVRIQLIADGQRSEPIDVEVVNDEAPPVLATRALGSCLKLTPTAEVVLASGAGAVQVRNDCSEPVQLGAPYPRRPVDGLQLGQSVLWPVTLDVGTSVSVPIAWGPSPAGTIEEIVFLEAISPMPDRRPITVWPSVE